jgi:4a-hydroxytetrahydrobiopterin dehydratase
METLTQMKCVACRTDAPTVTDAEIAELHPHVSDWDIVKLDGIKRLRRVFSLDDFAQALEFTKKVGKLAEEEGHHPALLTDESGSSRWPRRGGLKWPHPPSVFSLLLYRIVRPHAVKSSALRGACG